MATHSRTLAWKIPWTEEPCRLQSMGSLRVGHDWSDLAAAAAMNNYVEYFYMCFLLIGIPSFVKCVFKSLVYFDCIACFFIVSFSELFIHSGYNLMPDIYMYVYIYIHIHIFVYIPNIYFPSLWHAFKFLKFSSFLMLCLGEWIF